MDPSGAVGQGPGCRARGRPDNRRAAASEMLERLESQPDITLENMARAVLGLAAVSAGDYREADRQLTRCDEILTFYHAREPAADRFHGDHAEAVISLGDLERAERLVARLEERAAALPRPWIQVVAARSRGLLSAARGDLEAAAADFEGALEANGSVAMPSELGRTLLAMGRLHRRRYDGAARGIAWRRQRCLRTSWGSEMGGCGARGAAPSQRPPGPVMS